MIDPVTLEVLRNRFDAIAAQMQVTLLKSAVSVVLKEGADCACALFKGNGELLAQACANPIHLGIMGPAMEVLLRDFPGSTMREGDVYLLNDPYNGGTHIPDVIMAMPVIADGRLIALSAALAHQEDIGGKSFGSMPSDATEIYQEGFIIPPIRLYGQFGRNETAFRLLMANVRMPASLLGDFEAQLASIKLGARALHAAVEEFGSEVVVQSMNMILDQSEELMRRSIAQMPDGDYRFHDFVDNDGVDLDRRVKIAATVSIRGSEAVVDLSESAPQVRGPINSGFWGAFSAAAYAFRAFGDIEIHSDGGAVRPVNLIAAPGSIVNPVHPAPVGLRSITAKRVLDVVFGALGQAVPGRAMAASSGSMSVCSFSGLDDNGELFGCTDLTVGGMGGRNGKDGIDLIDTDITNTMNIPVEALEAHFPLRVLRTEYRADSGGPGEFRGGLGVVRLIQATRGPIRCSFRSDRHYTQPWGIEGGLPGASFQTHILRSDGTKVHVPTKQLFILEEGDVLEIHTGGGGGYGDPLMRSLDRIAADLADRKITSAAAARDYGVVVRADGRTIDRDASVVLRARRVAGRNTVWRETLRDTAVVSSGLFADPVSPDRI